MKHVHITLVGEQIAPVYNGILATNPNLVIFIHSDKTREHVQRIKQNLHLSSIPKELEIVIFAGANNSYFAILELLLLIYAIFISKSIFNI